MIQTASEDVITTYKIPLNNKVSMESWAPSSLPADSVASFLDVAWPKLGYRNLETRLGNCAVFISTARSVMRGLREESLIYSELPVTELLMISTTNNGMAGQNTYRLKQLFMPNWYSFKDGMKLITDREASSFALNEDIAIALSVDQGPGRHCDIFFREKVVGFIGDDGRVEIANKVIKRGQVAHILSNLEGS
jgi:hypothetical protein